VPSRRSRRDRRDAGVALQDRGARGDAASRPRTSPAASVRRGGMALRQPPGSAARSALAASGCFGNATTTPTGADEVPRCWHSFHVGVFLTLRDGGWKRLRLRLTLWLGFGVRRRGADCCCVRQSLLLASTEREELYTKRRLSQDQCKCLIPLVAALRRAVTTFTCRRRTGRRHRL
jgi:hypothetical protein